MTIISQSGNIQATDSKIFALLSDCTRFEKFLPPEVKNWKADADSCEFEIEGIAKMNIRATEKREFSQITYTLNNDKGLPASCCFDIDNQGDNCILKLTVNVEVPFFLNAMVKNPLQKVADMAVEKIKTAAEQA